MVGGGGSSWQDENSSRHRVPMVKAAQKEPSVTGHASAHIVTVLDKAVKVVS